MKHVHCNAIQTWVVKGTEIVISLQAGLLFFQLVLRLSAHPQWMNAVNSATNLKTALLQAIDSDSNMHSLLRRVVRYLLGRLNVDQLLANPDKRQLTHQIADQLIEKAAQTAAPAYSHFVYALLVHAGLVWFGLVWFGLVWFGLVCNVVISALADGRLW